MAQLPDFVSNTAIGCLCTSDLHGTPSGATVFYAVQNDKIYIMTHGASLKAQHIQKNPNVCFVVVDDATYRQAQMYATAKFVNNPGDYFPLLEQAIASYKLKTHELIPYMNIKTEGIAPVVIELTIHTNKHFSSGEGLVEQKLT